MESVYLRQGDLFLPEMPLPEGYIHMESMWSGFTKLVAFHGIEVQKGQEGKWQYDASAAKYTAIVLRFDQGKLAGEDTRNPHTETVFWGGITLYQIGKVHGASFEGHVPVCTGVIWSGVQEAHTHYDLRKLLFDKAQQGFGRVERLQAIVRGYEQQEDAKRRLESRTKHEEYQRAKFDEQERIFGTFGRGL